MATVDVAIVGGGIAGLSAAYELRQRGLSVIVLAAASRAGGVVNTEGTDGWGIDGGRAQCSFGSCSAGRCLQPRPEE